jgi:hypothetical protein
VNIQKNLIKNEETLQSSLEVIDFGIKVILQNVNVKIKSP